MTEASVAMLIRRPPSEVWEAFVDPAITAHFWFTRGESRLEQGRRTRWHWDMYGVTRDVIVTALEPGRRIAIDWDEADGTSAEWRFEEKPGGTFVTITARGFQPDNPDLAAQLVGVAEGFVLVLAGAKAWLEHGVELGLVGDRYPDAIQT